MRAWFARARRRGWNAERQEDQDVEDDQREERGQVGDRELVQADRARVGAVTPHGERLEQEQGAEYQ